MNFLVCDVSLLDRPHLITDKFISYEDGNVHWNEEGVHAPISWHSYASAMHGRFVSAPNDNWSEHMRWCDCVLITSNYNQQIAYDVARNAKKLGKVVIGAFHENFDFWQYNAKKNLDWVIDFRNFANACDGFLTYPYHEIAKDVWRGIGITTELLNFKQPYYLDVRNEYIKPRSERNGIFIGPSLKDNEIEKRNWIFNIGYAKDAILKKKAKPKITLINQSSVGINDLRQWFTKLDNTIEVNIVERQSYHDLLHLISTHEYLVNCDSSMTQGQLDYDASFVDVPLLETYIKTDVHLDIFQRDGIIFTSEEITQVLEKNYSFRASREQIIRWYDTILLKR